MAVKHGTKKAAPKAEERSGGGGRNLPKTPISVPENIGGGDLRLLPEGPAKAAIEKIMLGVSKANKPKATVRYTILENMDGDEMETVGEVVLESFSLQPQAIWKLNDLYKSVTGEKIPHGDFGPEEFEEMLNEKLGGAEFTLYLENQVPTDGSSDEERTTVVRREIA